jgi:hypothetical protein
MNSIFIVRAESGGCPESYIMGVYPTKELAYKRITFLENDMEYGFEYVWFDEILVGPDGGDCEFCNR